MFDFSPPIAAQSLAVVERLQQAGFIAYLAGGCVRDAMLGRQPKDFDVATDASPDTVRQVFGRRKTLAFGASFGVIGVLGEASVPTEVATFRSDGEYSDGRRPDSVRFGNAEHDAQRRDFTINGMFFDPVPQKLIDYVGGEVDLKQRVVRAIGDPHKRIEEDKLRMLRAVRSTASLGFELEPRTCLAIQQHAEQVHVVSGERIGAEMRRMLTGAGALQSIELLLATRLVPHIWPRLAAQIEHDAGAMSDVRRLLPHASQHSFEVSVATLFALIGSNVSEALSELTNAWKLSCEEQFAIEEAVTQRELILRADQLPWSQVQPVIASRAAEKIIATAESWARGFALPDAGVQFARTRFAWPREQLEPPPLITGDTLRRLGYRPGPRFGNVLQAVRNAQLDGLLPTIDEAIGFARKMLEE